MNNVEAKCYTCQLQRMGESGKHECRGLIDKAYEKAQALEYDCPFYKAKPNAKEIYQCFENFREK